MIKPNTFLIGAPKCGTSSLAHWMRQHPQVFFSLPKEPWFFNSDGLNRVTSYQDYEALFDDVSPECSVVAEGSTRYLYSDVAVPNILDYAPGACFIVCLRNPIEMAPSLHSQKLREGEENVKSFSKAWSLQAARADGRKLPPRRVGWGDEQLHYGSVCKLGKQLEILFSRVPRERVLCLMADDLKGHPSYEFQRVTRFLGISDRADIVFGNRNKNTKIRSRGISGTISRVAKIKRILGVRASFGVLNKANALNKPVVQRAKLKPKFRQELNDYFRQDIRKLSWLLDRDLTHWLD